MTDPFVSIILRSFNEGWALRETLPALAAQDYTNWELIVIDSGSTDGSVELLRQAAPRHFLQIQPHQYNPSRVINQGMQLASSGFGIFLNADATPQGSNWLRPLVQALRDPQTAAVFGRQVPRPDCRAVYAHDYERCFGPGRESARWEHFFSMASSGLRKDIWAKRGFLEKMRYSEDDEYTRWCRAQGYRIVYCPESVAMHSHNYSPEQAYRRSFGEAEALAAVWSGKPSAFNRPRTVWLGWLNDVRKDALYCARRRCVRELPHAAQIRRQQRQARLAGFRAGWRLYHLAGNTSPTGKHPRLPRFTLDGSDALEAELEQLCQRICAGVRAVIPDRKLAAVVLGGGYGRGEGGVLKTETGERPYNDLELYVFTRGNRLLNQRRYRTALERLSECLSPRTGLHVEFKLDSLPRLRHAPVSMYSYDLVAGHRTLFGGPRTFDGCKHHLQAGEILLGEATRLLLNRCTGLLLCQALLDQGTLAAEQQDFIGRNLAKMQLALGDVILTAFGQYHWSCLERERRLKELKNLFFDSRLARLSSQIIEHHAAGVAFKLHPSRAAKPPAEFAALHRQLSALAYQLWLWVESRRLGPRFSSVADYVFTSVNKFPETAGWRNWLLNLKTFGWKATCDPASLRYPRERLFNSLPLLLWKGEYSGKPESVRRLQEQLQTDASDWSGFLEAYKQLWPNYS